MEAITYFAKQTMKSNVPDLRAGDTVRVHQKIREGSKERIQIFEGIVIAVQGGKCVSGSFVVRRIASGIGVERIFPLHSPNIVKVERLKSSKVRRARLYYLRERSGRQARMRGEVRTLTGWEEAPVVVESGTAAAKEATETVEAQAEPEAVVSDNEIAVTVEPQPEPSPAGEPPKVETEE